MASSAGSNSFLRFIHHEFRCLTSEHFDGISHVRIGRDVRYQRGPMFQPDMDSRRGARPPDPLPKVTVAGCRWPIDRSSPHSMTKPPGASRSDTRRSSSLGQRRVVAMCATRISALFLGADAIYADRCRRCSPRAYSRLPSCVANQTCSMTSPSWLETRRKVLFSRGGDVGRGRSYRIVRHLSNCDRRQSR